MPTSTITTKGQVTIPKQIRDLLRINKGDRVEFLVDDGIVTIWPVTTDITELKGLIATPDKYVSIKDMKNAIREQGGRH